MAIQFIDPSNDAEERAKRNDLSNRFSSAGSKRIQRVYFRDLRRKVDIVLPYVPNKVSETILVDWVRHNVVGMSHQPLHYVGTQNHSFDSLELFFKAESTEDVTNIAEGRRNLMAACYPLNVNTDVERGSASRLLFIWPNLFSMTCVIKSLRITHEKFNHEGQPVQFRAVLSLEEIRDVRLGSEEVANFGTNRSETTSSTDPFDPNLNFE